MGMFRWMVVRVNDEDGVWVRWRGAQVFWEMERGNAMIAHEYTLVTKIRAECVWAMGYTTET